MANPSFSGVDAAAVAAPAKESEAERHGEEAQSLLDRKELAKYKDTYKRFWVSLVVSILSFLVAFLLLLFAFLLRRKKPDKAGEYAVISVWYILIFVVNTPPHIRVYGWFPPRDPRSKAEARLP